MCDIYLATKATNYYDIGKESRFRWISCNMGVWKWIRIRAYVRGVSKYL
nr:MAG TPA: hypothetical protein [Caudoviricetes sp.]